MACCRRTEDHQIGPRPLETFAIIGEDLAIRQTEVAARLCHSRRCLVADTHDLRLRMAHYHSQQIAHMKMIEVDPGHSHSLHLLKDS
jgi:hypothetical protein